MQCSGRQSSVQYLCVLIVMVSLILACARDSGADQRNVICGAGFPPTTYASISDAIASLPENSPTEPHTINVTGTCTESVNVINRQRITIQGQPPGATIVALVGDVGVLVAGSRAIILRDLVIQGGSRGVDVVRDSEVSLENCTIQNNEIGIQANQESVVTLSGGSAADPMRVHNNDVAGFLIQGASLLLLRGPVGAVLVQDNGDGVALLGSSTGGLGNATISGNSGVGVYVQNGSHASMGAGQISNNGFMPAPGALAGGVFLGNRSLFTADGTTISGNTGDGVIVGGEFAVNATLRLNNATVSGNSGNGVAARVGASVGLVGSSITGNTLDGIRLINASIAGFPESPGPPPAPAPNTITGNGGRGIFCDNTSRAFGDLSGINGRRTCTN
jgi:hypothetical protein